VLTKAELGAEIRAKREAVLVVNTGSRRGEAAFAAARSGLESRGIRVVESYPVRRGRNQLVVVGGGDGTLSSIVGAFAYKDAALGVLPLGTGNSFAQTLTVPRDLGGALDVIADGNVVDVDLGIVNGAYFSNVATIGLSADVARRTPHRLKRVSSPVAYLIVGAAQTIQHHAFEATVDDGERILALDTHQIIVANGRVFGATAITASAHVDNRNLAILTLRQESLAGLTHVARAADGPHRSPLRCDHVEQCGLHDRREAAAVHRRRRRSRHADSGTILVPRWFEEPFDEIERASAAG